LGGDEVYPVASAAEYDNRWRGPYRAALPVADGAPTTIFALPGNHDWYDGLTSFLRVFAQGDFVGGWRTEQTRSYFAVRLPHNWWLWAVDTQLGAYFDEPQLEYFEEAARGLGPDDRIVLCLAEPAWVHGEQEPSAYDNLDFFLRKILEPTGARVPVMLTGDYHHYARYQAAAHNRPPCAAEQLITCGGGGAYMVGTDHLPDVVTVPPADSTRPKRTEPTDYVLTETFPSQLTSRRLDWSVFGRLPWRNPGFAAMLGLFQTLLMLAFLTAPGTWGIDDWTINAPIGFAIVSVVAGTVLFAVVVGSGDARHWGVGVVHGVPHVALGAVGAWVWSTLPFADLPDPLALLLAFTLYLAFAGLAATWLLCAYLLVARRLRINANELYAGICVDDFKSFLRMHIGTDGALTIYPIGIERICRSWRADPDAPEAAPWIDPVTPIQAHLIEDPITLR
jgi:hypothetical protein